MREERFRNWIERWGWLIALAVCSAVVVLALADAFDAGAVLEHPLLAGSAVRALLGAASGLTLAACIPLMLFSVAAETRRLRALRRDLERRRVPHRGERSPERPPARR
jgi:hypothetical protein